MYSSMRQCEISGSERLKKISEFGLVSAFQYLPYSLKNVLRKYKVKEGMKGINLGSHCHLFWSQFSRLWYEVEGVVDPMARPRRIRHCDLIIFATRRLEGFFEGHIQPAQKEAADK